MNIYALFHFFYKTADKIASTYFVIATLTGCYSMRTNLIYLKTGKGKYLRL